MRDLTRSIGSFSWALSMFGMSQMFNVMRPDRIARALDHVTEATEGELRGALRTGYDLGDRMQRSFVDAAFGMLGPEMLDPRSWPRVVDDATGGAFRSAMGGFAGTGPCGPCADGAAKPKE